MADTADDLAPVKVAVIDSGIDATLPDFAGRIADARSFVGGSPYVDTEGHGTFVAGEIAANLDTQGIVGMAYTAQLLDREGRDAGRHDPARRRRRTRSAGRSTTARG